MIAPFVPKTLFQPPTIISCPWHPPKCWPLMPTPWHTRPQGNPHCRSISMMAPRKSSLFFLPLLGWYHCFFFHGCSCPWLHCCASPGIQLHHVIQKVQGVCGYISSMWTTAWSHTNNIYHQGPVRIQLACQWKWLKPPGLPGSSKKPMPWKASN